MEEHSIIFDFILISEFVCLYFLSTHLSASFTLPPSSSVTISSCAYVFVLAQQQVFESLLECGIAQCIASRVDGGVDITQPVANRPHRVRDTGVTEG